MPFCPSYVILRLVFYLPTIYFFESSFEGDMLIENSISFCLLVMFFFITLLLKRWFHVCTTLSGQFFPQKFESDISLF